MSREIPIHAPSGWLMLPVNLALAIGGFAATIWVIVLTDHYGGNFAWFLLLTEKDEVQKWHVLRFRHSLRVR